MHARKRPEAVLSRPADELVVLKQEQRIVGLFRLAEAGDAEVLFTVEQTGAACHTGNHSCFFKKLK